MDPFMSRFDTGQTLLGDQSEVGHCQVDSERPDLSIQSGSSDSE